MGPEGERTPLRELGRTFPLLLLELLAATAIGLLLLVIAVSLPSEPVADSVRRSIDTLEAQTSYYVADPERDTGTVSNTTIDNFTDAWMLDTAYYDGAGLSQVLLAARWGSDDGPLATLRQQFEEPDVVTVRPYARYWSGYLAFLRPALALGFDIDAIRLGNAIVQGCLLAAALVLCAWRRAALLIPAFLGTLLAAQAWVVPIALTYSGVACLTLIACVVLLAVRRLASDYRAALLLFGAIGMATQYIDLLTAPLLSFGVPACVYVYLVRCERPGRSLAGVFGIGLYWAIGYGAFWAMKWVLGAVFLGPWVLESVVEAAESRGAGIEGGTTLGSRLAAIPVLANHYLMPFPKRAIAAFTAGYGVAALACLLGFRGRRRREGSRAKSRRTRTLVAALAALALVLATPFAWYLTFANHSVQHQFMTFRTFAVAVFAAFTMLSAILRFLAPPRGPMAGEPIAVPAHGTGRAAAAATPPHPIGGTASRRRAAATAPARRRSAG